MTILHFASINDYMFSGVCVAVPQHITSQGEFADVGLVNLKNYRVPHIDNQFDFSDNFKINELPAPFNKPDIVVFHEVYRVEYLKIYPMLLRKKIPYVIIPHGELRKEAQQKKKLKKTVANILLFNRFINYAAAIQCLSQLELDSSNFGKNKFIGTNGVCITDKKKETFNNEKIDFVYIGRLEARVKGLDLLIEAARIKSESLKQNNATIYIYGPDLNGRFANVRSLIKENGVEDIVKLKHEVIGEEKEKIILDADAFIQTSRFEGMPMGILEALSYGVPCLVTKGTNLAEFITENNCGWGCETTVAEIAKTLETVIAEKETLQQKSVAARQAIENNFDWDIVSKQTVEYYKNLCR